MPINDLCSPKHNQNEYQKLSTEIMSYVRKAQCAPEKGLEDWIAEVSAALVTF